MKIFLAADLEGCASVATWEEIYPGNKNYDRATDEMTREVAAACQALLDVGAEVYIKDSHFEGKNIDFSKLPAGVKMIRNHGGHPDMMIQGINETFDAAAFIGFHAGANNDRFIYRRSWKLCSNGRYDKPQRRNNICTCSC